MKRIIILAAFCACCGGTSSQTLAVDLPIERVDTATGACTAQNTASAGLSGICSGSHVTDSDNDADDSIDPDRAEAISQTTASICSGSVGSTVDSLGEILVGQLGVNYIPQQNADIAVNMGGYVSGSTTGTVGAGNGSNPVLPLGVTTTGSYSILPDPVNPNYDQGTLVISLIVSVSGGDHLTEEAYAACGGSWVRVSTSPSGTVTVQGSLEQAGGSPVSIYSSFSGTSYTHTYSASRYVSAGDGFNMSANCKASGSIYLFGMSNGVIGGPSSHVDCEVVDAY